MHVNTKRIESLIHELLLEIGEDPEREGFASRKPRARNSSP